MGVQLALVTLNQAVKRADAAAKVAGEQREYHKILSKFNKTIEKVQLPPPPPIPPFSFLLSSSSPAPPTFAQQFPMNITKAYRDIEMDKVALQRPHETSCGIIIVLATGSFMNGCDDGGVQDLMNVVIDEHLYREGLVETARQFEEETGIEIPHELKDPLQQLHAILRAIHLRDLQPAIQYASTFYHSTHSATVPCIPTAVRRCTFRPCDGVWGGGG